MRLPKTVQTFRAVSADKNQVMKVAEESLETFSAWENYRGDPSEDNRVLLRDECCDVIQATCNLLAALGFTDLTEAMAACERRNRERGRY